MKRIWRDQIKSVELTAFQESMLQAGLWEFHDMEDQVPRCADVSVGFCICNGRGVLSEDRRLSDEVINNDLLVRILPVWLLVTN